MTTTCYVALGANLGDPLATLIWARAQVGGLGYLTGISALYATDPVGGPEGQPEYLNAALQLESWLDAPELLSSLHRIEAAAGRERLIRWAARTLDLDLITYGTLCQDTPELTLPHPRAWERGFVLAPLCDLNPTLPHPQTGELACDALSRVGLAGVRRVASHW